MLSNDEKRKDDLDQRQPRTQDNIILQEGMLSEFLSWCEVPEGP